MDGVSGSWRVCCQTQRLHLSGIVEGNQITSATGSLPRWERLQPFRPPLRFLLRLAAGAIRRSMLHYLSEAKPGKEADVAEFLKGGLPLAEAEPATIAWF